MRNYWAEILELNAGEPRNDFVEVRIQYCLVSVPDEIYLWYKTPDL